jgi:glycerol kinase
MSDRMILVLDEGTTSTRAMLFGADGRQHGVSQRELTQYYPQPGWVEHDAAEIWDKTLACALQMVEKAGGADHIAAIGITNQRETVVAWDKQTGEPLARALVWQDRRTAGFCAELKTAGHEAAVQAKTGLLLDPYFSATKMRWLIDNDPSVGTAARQGRLALGTVENWLAFKLTGGLHISDASNASRTLLLGLDGESFDPELCALFGVPLAALPVVTDNAGELGMTSPDLFGRAIPITGMAGDQQAATVGQACLKPGDTKVTYGTGAFILTCTGEALPRSNNRLLGTILCQLAGKRLYAVEGSVFVAGSLIKWLRDSLGIIETAGETEVLARSIDDSHGVVIVPAHTGLGAPHWQPDARGIISGLSFAAGKAHLARAALEAMSYQTHDLAQAYAADGVEWTSLRIDGGMSANDWMVQDIADLLDLPVIRPDFVETTALGAAMLAAVGAGIHASLEGAAKAMIGSTTTFQPNMPGQIREARLTAWAEALAKV